MKKHQDSIEKVQSRATRLLPEIAHLSYTDRLLTLGLPSLKYRQERTDVLQLFKITHGFDTVSISSTCPICNNPMFKPSLATHTRGHPCKFQVQHTSGPRRNFFSTNGDIANVDKDFDLSDISVSSEGTVDLTDFDCLSDNNNGDVDVMLMIIITHLAMCYNI